MTDRVPMDAARRSFCTFRLERRLYGIEVSHVREVSPHLPATPVPQTSPAVRGLVNLRSHIYLVLDLRPLLGMPAIPCTPESRLIILKPEVGQDVGVLVEQGGDIVHVRSEQIEPATGAADASAPGASWLIAGVCKLDAELLIMIDPTRLAELVMKPI